MCRLRNKAIRDNQESVTTGQTHTHTDAGQSDPYVPLCFADDTKIKIQNTWMPFLNLYSFLVLFSGIYQLQGHAH